jgi:predicted nucleic acid-binding protein
LKVVLDTCVLKLATFSSTDNAAALIYQLVQTGLIEAWVSPAMLDEYDDVLDDRPDLLAEISDLCRFCHPLTELNIIRHEPDNRFLECSLAAEVDFLVTVNTARGHFDRKNYDRVRIVTPGEFLKLKEVRPLLNKLAED